jgi:hypothetical protein
MSRGNPTSCSWKGCTATAEMPFTEGWGFADAMPPNMPEEGYLCPKHGRAYEYLAVNLDLENDEPKGLSLGRDGELGEEQRGKSSKESDTMKGHGHAATEIKGV